MQDYYFISIHHSKANPEIIALSQKKPSKSSQYITYFIDSDSYNASYYDTGLAHRDYLCESSEEFIQKVWEAKSLNLLN